MIISLDRYKKNSGGGSGGIIPSGTISITENGSYNVYNYASAKVDVQSDGTANTYSIYDGSIDTNGLRDIGWDDESIGYFKDSVNWYSWANDSYKVSSGNKSIYNRLNSFPVPPRVVIEEYKYNEDFKFCPMIALPQANILFQDFEHLEYIPKFNTSEFNNFSSMFYGCEKLNTIPKLDTSNAIKMRYMFYKCTNLKSVPLLDTSNVTDMYGMFMNCGKLETVPLFDTSNVTLMFDMFEGCNNLKSVPLLDTSNVTDMGYMFSDCKMLESVPLFDTSKVTSMGYMFRGCTNLQSVPLLDTSKVTNTSNMFRGCTNLQSVSQFDLSNVNDMRYMFGSCTNLQSLPSINAPICRSMEYFIQGCSGLTRIESVNFSGFNSDMELSYEWDSIPLEHIIFNGSLNANIVHLNYYPSLDDESIMSTLQAASQTPEEEKYKELYFPNKTYFGEANTPEGLMDLVNECTNKNWTITGLTILSDEDLENIGNPDEAITVTLQEFVEAEPNTNQWYRLTVTLDNCPRMEAGIWCVSEEGFEPPVWFEGKPTVLINGITNDGIKFDYENAYEFFPGDGSTITILTQKHYTEEDIELDSGDGWSISIPAGATFGGKFNVSPLAIYVA